MSTLMIVLVLVAIFMTIVLKIYEHSNFYLDRYKVRKIDNKKYLTRMGFEQVEKDKLRLKVLEMNARLKYTS